MTKFIADPEFWALFPEASIGILSVTNVQEDIKLTEDKAKEIKEYLDHANEEAKKYLVSDVISENPVVQTWRQAYQKFPTKKGARSSVENLLKRLLNGKPVGTIAPTVDITNAISLKYALPIGAENMDAFDGDIRLGVMKGTEQFLPIGEDKNDPPRPGELAYYDNTGVICRCWNWRDGVRTEVTDSTRNEFIAMECVDPSRVPELQAALDELADMLRKYVGAEVFTKTIITKDHPETDIH